MRRDEDAFLMAIRADPADDAVRLVYADWLDERGDPRGDFLRLHLALKSLSPDHLHRVSGEEELSQLRNNADPGWLAVVEPEGIPPPEARLHQPTCDCFEAGYENRKWSEVEFHRTAQDTECDAWKRLLDLIEAAAADGGTAFAPLRELPREDRPRIVTLPPTLAKLTAVKQLDLYRSHLVRIPPEIGEMTSLEEFIPYTSWRLHWFPYEITRCKNLRDSTVSTRVLYGNFKYWPPFPRLQPRTVYADGRVEPKRLPLKYRTPPAVRNCSVCARPFEDRRLHRVWISLGVATDVLPLLVNACSAECVANLPQPPDGYAAEPHRGGVGTAGPRQR
jgi:uncharacterized protein (TIGR02996 family)